MVLRTRADLKAFLSLVANDWRMDYHPSWKDAHMRKWNMYLVLMQAGYNQYEIPLNTPTMSLKTLKEKAALDNGLEGRWRRALEAYNLKLTLPVESEFKVNDKVVKVKEVFKSKPEMKVIDKNTAPAPTPNLEHRIKTLEDSLNLVQQVADSAHEVAVEALTSSSSSNGADINGDDSDIHETNARAEVEITDEVQKLKSSERAPTESEIPESITSYEEAERIKNIMIKYGFIEDWGKVYYKTPNMTYKEWSRVRLYGGYELHESAPHWLIKCYRILRTWWLDKGKYHWQSVRSFIRDNTNGSSQLHNGEDLKSMPYGTFRRLSTSMSFDKYDKQRIECIPLQSEIDKILAFRREQIWQYRRGLIEEIVWAPPFTYTSLYGNAEYRAYWTPERRKEAQERRLKEAAEFNEV